MGLFNKRELPPGYLKVRFLCLRSNKLFDELRAFIANVKPHEERIEFYKFGLHFVLELKDYLGKPTTVSKNILYDTVVCYAMFFDKFSLEQQFPGTFGEKYGFLNKFSPNKTSTSQEELPKRRKEKGRDVSYIFT
ncbi:MAG: hypothetical protein GF364_17140, partial [Candidatus Lokiarchaeota archaeon]|nr:hypothetical protein [Candidatus Lokiarchaeota archaeon]